MGFSMNIIDLNSFLYTFIFDTATEFILQTIFLLLKLNKNSVDLNSSFSQTIGTNLKLARRWLSLNGMQRKNKTITPQKNDQKIKAIYNG